MPELDDNGDNTITLSAKNRQTIETANQLLVDGGVIGSDYNKNYNFIMLIVQSLNIKKMYDNRHFSTKCCIYT